MDLGAWFLAWLDLSLEVIIWIILGGVGLGMGSFFYFEFKRGFAKGGNIS